MKGIRLPDGFDYTTPYLERLGYETTPSGAYWRDPNGLWYVVSPNGLLGLISKHTVVENEDGTITVSPSILIYPIPDSESPERRQGWHGWLEKGEWRDAS